MTPDKTPSAPTEKESKELAHLQDISAVTNNIEIIMEHFPMLTLREFFLDIIQATKKDATDQEVAEFIGGLVKELQRA